MIAAINYTYLGAVSAFDTSITLIRTEMPDVVISDIRLGDNKTGIDLAHAVSDLDIPFVFITAYSDAAVYEDSKGYEKSKFLVKPFDKLTLKSILDSLTADNIELSSGKKIIDKVLYIKRNNEYEKVALESINYIYSEGNYIKLFGDDEEYTLKYSLSKLLELSKFENFIRVHRSYAVNKGRVLKINFSDKIITIQNVEIPFGRTYSKDVRSLMEFQTEADKS